MQWGIMGRKPEREEAVGTEHPSPHGCPARTRGLGERGDRVGGSPQWTVVQGKWATCGRGDKKGKSHLFLQNLETQPLGGK